MKQLESINPYNHKIVGRYQQHSRLEVDQIIRNAHACFKSWRKTTFAERQNLLNEVASILQKQTDKYALMITAEMGKPISQARAEVEKCAWVCSYYAEKAEEQLAPQLYVTDAEKSYARFDPLGVVLAVMPWNYPFWQVFRFAAPALMAGNVCLLKHASNVTGAALMLQQIFTEAGLPSFGFSTLKIPSSMVGSVIDHELVRAVTLTGSERAGSAVASRAGKNLKKTVLELGGNNALIVLPDCEMESTLETCLQARFQNTGQSCIAGKRLLLHSQIAEEFCDRLVYKVMDLKTGDPMDNSTFIGVLAREDLAAGLEEQLNNSIAQGARILCGGNRNKAFFEPTLVSGVKPGMALFDQETFGPVLAISTFDSLDKAIELSNNSAYGLGVSVFTSDIPGIVDRLPDFEEGAVFINELVKSDPGLPFGGVKGSGYGRELSEHGIREFTNVKTVYIK